MFISTFMQIFMQKKSPKNHQKSETFKKNPQSNRLGNSTESPITRFHCTVVALKILKVYAFFESFVGKNAVANLGTPDSGVKLRAAT